MLEAIAISLEAIASRLEAITIRLEAIAVRLEVIFVVSFLNLPGIWLGGLPRDITDSEVEGVCSRCACCFMVLRSLLERDKTSHVMSCPRFSRKDGTDLSVTGSMFSITR